MVNRSDVYTYIQCWQIIWTFYCYSFSQEFPSLRSLPGQFARWAEARTEPEDDITNDQAWPGQSNYQQQSRQGVHSPQSTVHSVAQCRSGLFYHDGAEAEQSSYQSRQSQSGIIFTWMGGLWNCIYCFIFRLFRATSEVTMFLWIMRKVWRTSDDK